MLSDRLTAIFEAGGYALGYFELPVGSGKEVVGALTWDAEAGAELRVISDGEGLDRAGENLDVVGQLEFGDEIFIPRALITKSGSGPINRERAVGSRMIVGVTEEPLEGWTSAGLETHNLHEWWPETGIEHDHGGDQDGNEAVVSVSWRPPESRVVQLPWGTVHFAITMPQRYAYAPDWHMETMLRISAKFDSPRPIAAIDRDFIFPMVSFAAFAADYPDAPKSFNVFRPEKLASVHDRRDVFIQREWQPGREMLFSEADLENFEDVVRRWFELAEEFRPVITSLLDATNQGNLYSVPRLLGLVAGLEAFHRIKYGTNVELFDRLKSLRKESSLDAHDWCSNRNLELIVASRNYYSHLEGPKRGFTDEEVDQGVFSSTRRALALLQASLLRELGFDDELIAGRLAAHYSNWPLPS